MQTDSFKINGAYASPFLLASFGLSQGQQSVVQANYSFYGTGDWSPLLIFDYGKDSTFTKVNKTVYNPSTLMPTGIDANKQNDINYTIYPNPATTNNVNMQFTKNAPGKWVISIVNASGKTIKTIEDNSPAGEVKTELTLPALANGIYFLNITNENGENMGTTKLTVLNK